MVLAFAGLSTINKFFDIFRRGKKIRQTPFSVLTFKTSNTVLTALSMQGLDYSGIFRNLKGSSHQIRRA